MRDFAYAIPPIFAISITDNRLTRVHYHVSIRAIVPVRRDDFQKLPGKLQESPVVHACATMRTDRTDGHARVFTRARPIRRASERTVPISMYQRVTALFSTVTSLSSFIAVRIAIARDNDASIGILLSACKYTMCRCGIREMRSAPECTVDMEVVRSSRIQLSCKRGNRNEMKQSFK